MFINKNLIMSLRILATIITSLFIMNSISAKQLDYRLPKSVLPTSQQLALELDPSKDGYSGNTVIELNVVEAVDKIGIYYKEINIESVSLVSKTYERALTATSGVYDINWLSDDKAISVGKYQLKITFSADYSKDALGLYKTKYQGNDYLFTQFEALFARRAFPIFDEPDFKIPYQLTMTVPKHLTVATNTPVLKETVEGNMKTVSFKKTPPMPSYLIALIVGDFDKTAITGLSVPGYIYSPKGTGGETGFAIKNTPHILTSLEDYFGIKYPYEKLDFVAVPDYAFGAMENAGLVTYRTELLLRGDTASANAAAATLNVIAHELAHMWYGDLVTMKWWDDLWLNEAFATWMAQKILSIEYPQYKSNLNLPQEGAFGEDGLVATKPIRKEIKNAKDIEDGMGLNYSKGHAILNMLEQTLGEKKFQLAIQKYMKTNSWKNAVADDLWAAFAEQSTFDIAEIANTFLNQPGYAIVSFNENGEVTQKRFRNFGTEVPEQDWKVPLTIKYKKNGKISQQQILLTEEKLKIVTLIESEWFFPVTNGNGYFRWKMPKDKYSALINDVNSLNNREKIALLSNSSGLLDAGEISIKEHLTLLTSLANEYDPVVFLKVLEEIKLMGETHSDLSNQKAFSDYVTKTLTPWYERIGSKTRKIDDEGILQLRPRLLRVLGQLGNNPQLNKELQSLAKAYLKEEGNIDDNLGREALRINAMLDDGAMVETYFDTYLATSNASLKSNIMSSMYFTDDKPVTYVLEKSIDDALPAGDKFRPLVGIFYINKDQTLIYNWLEEHFDEVLAALPQIYRGYLPLIMSANCQETNLNLLKGFFKDKGETYQASLSKAIESEGNCLALKKREAKSFNEFLSL